MPEQDSPLLTRTQAGVLEQDSPLLTRRRPCRSKQAGVLEQDSPVLTRTQAGVLEQDSPLLTRERVSSGQASTDERG